LQLSKRDYFLWLDKSPSAPRYNERQREELRCVTGRSGDTLVRQLVVAPGYVGQ